MEENEQYKKYLDENFTEEYITELREKAAKKLNRQILFRSILRLIIAIILGITSAKQDDWSVIVNVGWKYIVIEYIWVFIYSTYMIYRRNTQRGLPEWYSADNAVSFAFKTSWNQLLLSSIFIGSVASIIKLITNIFI